MGHEGPVQSGCAPERCLPLRWRESTIRQDLKCVAQNAEWTRPDLLGLAAYFAGSSVPVRVRNDHISRRGLDREGVAA
eukprot:11173339-Lingulodinium_polyedra.AAC.1